MGTTTVGFLKFLFRRSRQSEQCCPQPATYNSAESAKQRGNELLAQGEIERAAACYEVAIRIDPEFAEAYNNLGLACLEMEQYEKAEGLLERALTLKPELVQAHFNLVLISQQACSWGNRELHVRKLLSLLRQDDSPALPPFSLLAIPEVGPDALKAANRRWAISNFPCGPDVPALTSGIRPRRNERLRIGYLSADFHEHATTQLLAGVLESHDVSKFDILAYSIGPDRQDDARSRVQGACKIFRDLRLDDDSTAARRIATDGVDILVDLKGYTQNCRPGINALRPAPVIANWLGYPCTLGHRRLADYLIGDPIVTPPEHAAHYSESLALLPHCYQPNDRKRQIAAAATRQAEGLPERGFIFCSFNQTYKISPVSFNLWCRLLVDLPGSVLWLMEATDHAMDNLRREADIRGVASDRLIFARHKPLDQHLARLQLADLALDTFPYSSHTTGSDALWAGVPLAALIGDTFPSRVSASLLHAVGLPELVAHDVSAYHSLVMDIAASPARLAALRARLASERLSAPLFDTPRFTRDLEALYCSIWTHAQHSRRATPSAP